MFARFNQSRLLRYAGLFTWAVIGMPLLLLSLMPPDQARLGEEAVGTSHIGWQAWVAYAAFGIRYGWLTQGPGTRRVLAPHYAVRVVLAGRARAVAYFQNDNRPYVINWDSIAYDSRDFLVMGDPFETYTEEVTKFLSAKRAAPPEETC